MHDVLVLFMFFLMADWTRVGSELYYRKILRGVSSKPLTAVSSFTLLIDFQY